MNTQEMIDHIAANIEAKLSTLEHATIEKRIAAIKKSLEVLSERLTYANATAGTTQGMGDGAGPSGSVPEPATAEHATYHGEYRGYDFVSRWREKDC